MDTEQKLTTLETKIKLSTLWIVVLLNMLFRDMHEFARPGFLEELLAMTTNGAQISEGLLLVAGIVLEIPIMMIFLTQLLDINVNRWANIVASVFTMVAIISNTLNPDLDDIFFAVAECVALLLIIWFAWSWSTEPVRKIA